MKTARPIFASAALIASLFVSASAGTMETGAPQPPPPPSPTSVVNEGEEAPAEGTMSTWNASADAVTQVTLNLLHGALALF